MTSTDELLRRAYPTVLARVLGAIGDLAEAEDAVQEAVARALVAWRDDGRPDEPVAWLVTVARNVHRDELRRHRRGQAQRPAIERIAARSPWTRRGGEAVELFAWPDDALRLVFTCCDPVLAIEERAALALATVAGLTPEEIGRALLVGRSAMERRLGRARSRLRERRGRYEVPMPRVAPERLAAVLAVIHFVYNEGHWSSTDAAPIRRDLTGLAFDWATALAHLLPEEPEVAGLRALLMLHEARMPARLDDAGRPLTLEQQDRRRWDALAIARARALLDDALARQRPGPFQVEAAIAAVHCAAPTAEATDWNEIASLYASLEAMRPSPVVRLNRAFAVGRVEGPEVGLALLASIEGDERMERYGPFQLVRGVLLAEAGRRGEAAEALERARALAPNAAERDQITGRLDALRRSGPNEVRGIDSGD